MILEGRTSHPNSYCWKCTRISYSQGNNKHLEAHVVPVSFYKTRTVLPPCHLHLWLEVLLGERSRASKVADVLQHPRCQPARPRANSAQSETQLLLQCAQGSAAQCELADIPCARGLRCHFMALPVQLSIHGRPAFLILGEV